MYGRKEVEELAGELEGFGYKELRSDLYSLAILSPVYIFTLVKKLIATRELLDYYAPTFPFPMLDRFIAWAEHGFEERGAEDEENSGK